MFEFLIALGLALMIIGVLTLEIILIVIGVALICAAAMF